MYCDACGAPLAESQQFCRACGKPVGGVPALPQASRIQGHVRLLGILWLALSALRLISAICAVAFVRSCLPLLAPGTPLPAFLQPLVIFFGYWLGLNALAGFLTGWGLLQREPWARWLALVLGCFALLDPPLGTLLGIYTLWVLLAHGAERDYRRLARVA